MLKWKFQDLQLNIFPIYSSVLTISTNYAVCPSSGLVSYKILS